MLRSRRNTVDDYGNFLDDDATSIGEDMKILNDGLLDGCQFFFFNYIFVTRKRALGVGRGALSNTASTQPVFIHCISNIFIIVTLQKPHRLQTY